MSEAGSDEMGEKSAAVAATAALALGLSAAASTAESTYQKPPAAVQAVLNAPPAPLVNFSPARDRMVLIDWIRYPPIEDLARPMLRLAGLRLNPKTNGPHSPRRYVGFRIRNVADGKEIVVTVPEGAHLGTPVWSPDSSHFAFSHTRADGMELWVANAATGQARKMEKVRLNGALGFLFRWMPDGKSLLCQTLVSKDPPPEPNTTPTGPVIQESFGDKSPVRTFQDLLKNPHDEAMFEYFTTSRLTMVEIDSGRVRHVGEPAMFLNVQPSPDGKFLLTSQVRKPFSYQLTVGAFPKRVDVLNLRGEIRKTLADLPAEEKVPIGGVPIGPRSIEWIPTEPATIQWVEARDGGDPKRKVPYRDQIRVWSAPFEGDPTDLARTEHRYTGLSWLENGVQGLLYEYDRDRLWRRTRLIDRKGDNENAHVLWDLSINDRYGDPGSPAFKTLPNGFSAVRVKNDHLYLLGDGATPEGERPFLDRLSLKTFKSERLFQCAPGAFEDVLMVVGDDAARFITRRESPSEPPNYLLHTVGKDKPKPLTDFKDPTPQIRGIKKRLVSYQREDGVPLSFELYLPPNYKEGTRLPTIVWAYPNEFGDAATAGQVSGSADHFTTLAGTTHLFFLLQGYAVLDNVSMPVVGNPETVNDTFVEQIVAAAKAAINKAVELGVTDPDRVGVGGHSYGAFMTANLLAHSDLFRAGIARSGAYNRTLTPFGFQSERRTLWEARDVYSKLSPFMYADRIKEPLLLVHGEADNNPGTFPMQSERLFHAIKGTGGNVRYVVLPNEAHGYVSRESVEHTLFEMMGWFDRFVKNAGPRAKPVGSSD